MCSVLYLNISKTLKLQVYAMLDNTNQMMPVQNVLLDNTVRLVWNNVPHVKQIR